MSVDKPSLAYRALRRVVMLFYPPFECEGVENLPSEPCVVAGNHSQLHGPLAMELYPPRKHYTWCVGQMMKLKEVPGYAFMDFWSKKPKSVRWLFKLASYLIAPLCVFIFNNAAVIPVYRDTRLLGTFKESVKRLSEGADVVIYPENYTPRNDIVHEFQEGFVDVALFYKKKTGEDLSFVPMYMCPAERKMYYGKPTKFDSSAPAKEELKRVREYLMDEITKIAVSLPRHRVVPYPNVPKKDYPYNRQ